MTDRILEQALFGKRIFSQDRKMPDFEYQEFAAKNKATLRIEHKPGERMEVDWAGNRAGLIDNITGKPIPVYVFVAALPCSGYVYAQGFLERLYGRPSQYSTVIEYMPEKHRRYAEWNAQRFIRWASEIGPSTEQTVNAVIASRKVEQQSYKTCLALLKLADSYSVARLEAACAKALAYARVSSFKSIRAILKTESDRQTTAPLPAPDESSSSFACTRGAAYYGGSNDGE
ncbi:MAG: hypothetical protein LBQ43_03420 [Holosporales bacterium]|nr:hypothetical protein [Holosporales bacterium]